MKIVACLAALAALVAIAAAQPAYLQSPPAQYYVELDFQLPIMGTHEPVAVWYDAINNQQRMEFWNGLDTFLYTHDDTTLYSYQVTPESAPYQHNQCIYNTATSLTGWDLPVVAPIPDVNDGSYEYAGTDTVNGVACYKYEIVENIYDTPNNYTMWIDQTTQAPVRFEMIGFNGYLGQLNYDWFVVDVKTYTPGPIASSAWDLPSECSNGKQQEGNVISAAAHMRRFQPVSPHKMFNDFKSQHGKTYDGEEHELRFKNYHYNLNRIMAHNRQGKSYTLAINHLADTSEAERTSMRGYRYPGKPNNAKMVHEVSGKELPEFVDWTAEGAVHPLKEQGDCGSCWTFSTTGALQSAVYLTYGYMPSFSEQYLIDCSWAYGNIGCGGGDQSVAYDFIMEAGGIPTEEDYPYLEQNGICNATATPAIEVQYYVNVTGFNETALMDAVATVGPIAISIDASLYTFTFYHAGVYDDQDCEQGLNDLDHAVVLTGYGTDSYGNDYWIVQNSWSPYYGRNGYVYISRDDNLCGVGSQPVYPVV